MKKIFGIMMVLFAMVLMPNVSSAESCNPRGGVCVGTPTGKPCGALHQSCCNVNGYDYDCNSSSLSCMPNSNTCVPSTIYCSVECYSNLKIFYVPLEVFGSDTTAEVLTLAQLYCQNQQSQYIGYSCSNY